MPDDEQDPTESVATGGDQTEAAPTFAPDHDSDAQNPRPGSDEAPVTRKQLEDQHKAVGEALESITRQQEKNTDYENQMTLDLQKLKEQAAQPPIAEPAPIELPPPFTQEQKFTAGTLITGLLKWGALLGLAYGVSRRSPMRGAIFKLALGSALESYAQGRNRDRNQALALWEKNRQFIADQNKEQHQRYIDHVNNKKTDWRQRFDIISKEAEIWQNKRLHDAALRQDANALRQTLNDELRLHNDWEKQTKKDRAEWYKLFGMSGVDGEKYRQYILKKGGPDIRGMSPEQEAEVEKKYPRWQQIEEMQKEADQRAIDTAAKKAGAEQRARDEAKTEDEQKKEEEARHQKFGTKENPLGLNLEP